MGGGGGKEEESMFRREGEEGWAREKRELDVEEEEGRKDGEMSFEL